MDNNRENLLVTVAMLTYNSAQFLRAAIDSVLASTYTNFELIISDDCSTDESWAIIQSYKDERIKAIKQEQNLGEYNNRNFCLYRAKGKYIAYIDGDDLIRPAGLKVFLNHLKEHPECGMAISRPKPKTLRNLLSSQEAFRLHYLDKTMLNMALVRVCFNTEKFKILGGFSNLYKSGDDYARLLVASKYPTLIVEDNLVWWRKSPNSASDRLFNSYSGVYEPFAIKYYFLNSTKLLTQKEITLAHKKLNLAYYNTLKSLIKRGKLKWLAKMIFDYSKIRRIGKNKSYD